MQGFINFGLFISILFTTYMFGADRTYKKGWEQGYKKGLEERETLKK